MKALPQKRRRAGTIKLQLPTFNPVLSTLMRLVQKARHGVVSIGEVDQLEGLLQSLPLASG
jgi:hypothetical protein